MIRWESTETNPFFEKTSEKAIKYACNALVTETLLDNDHKGVPSNDNNLDPPKERVCDLFDKRLLHPQDRSTQSS